MSRPKHNDPCPCGSGKKYRNCHLQADRQARQQQASTPLSPPPQQASAPTPTRRPPWLRALPWVVGGLGSATGIWIATAHSQQGGLAAVVASVVIAGMITVFGDPPPPRDDAGDPGAINFGR